MAVKSKLYYLTSHGYELPLYVGPSHQLITKPAHNIPTIMWPDGRWCFEANSYMLRLYNRGLSRRDGGGTLHTYATNISHFIRYCHFNKIHLPDITDNQFTFFMISIQGELRGENQNMKARNSNSVRAIGNNCLDFLFVVSKLHSLDNFMGLDGQIRAERRKHELKPSKGKMGAMSIVQESWHHHSFPPPNPVLKRLPITSETATRLRDAILPLSKDLYIRKRRYILIKLLEITGGRRSEVAALTVASVRNAAKMANPMLQLLTVKKRGGREAYRLIPIARHDVAVLEEFIEKNRRRVVRKTCGLNNDEGLLLVSATTGKGLRPNTITQELSALAAAAKIEEQACAHMFRHRFITKLFVALIEQHSFENVDSFRKALLDQEALKREVQQWTGHENVESLEVYLHLAFDEITEFKKTCDVVLAKHSMESLKISLRQAKGELLDGASPAEVLETLLTIIEVANRDLP